MEIHCKGFSTYLRGLGHDDADAVAAIANDFEIAYNIAELGKFPYPYYRDDALKFIDSAAIELSHGVGLHMGIFLEKTGELVGIAGLQDMDATSKKCEIG